EPRGGEDLLEDLLRVSAVRDLFAHAATPLRPEPVERLGLGLVRVGALCDAVLPPPALRLSIATGPEVVEQVALESERDAATRRRSVEAGEGDEQRLVDLALGLAQVTVWREVSAE